MKEIVIDEMGYAKAPIDDKNVMSDSIVESLFDDGAYVLNSKESVGFIDGYPVYARYFRNVLILGMVRSTVGDCNIDKNWMDVAASNLVGEKVSLFPEIKTIHSSKSFLLDDNNKEVPERQLIITFANVSDTKLRITFHYNFKD